MAFKDILVHVDNVQSCPSRLELAVNFAQRHGARLIGLHVRGQMQLPGFMAPDYDGQMSRLQNRIAEDAAMAAQSYFRRAVEQGGVVCEWRDVTGDLVDQVTLHARHADLAIVGQDDIDAEDPLADNRLAEMLALEAGTPILVVPYVGRYPEIGKRVLVAWNASREAKRAIADAMPILIAASSVKVLAINPKEGPLGHGDIAGADISLHLARHGVPATCESIQASDLTVGDMLLSRAADDGVDLLVMGAYGRSRLRELVLGGATRHILHHMTVPVLMSH